MMPIAPFAPRPVPRDVEARRSRIAVAAAVVGIAAALLAYAVSPGIRHAVGHAAHGVGTAVDKVADRVFPDRARAAPPLPRESLRGSAITLKALAGRPALIAFWSPRCAGCRAEAAAVATLAAGIGAGRVVGVADGGSRAADLAWVRRHRWEFPNLRDGSGAVSARYGVAAPGRLPVAVAIDSRGHITKVLRGPQTLAALQHALYPHTASK
jgi:peroxiredoxin